MIYENSFLVFRPMSLQVLLGRGDLKDGQIVQFEEHQIHEGMESSRKTELTAFFDLNRKLNAMNTPIEEMPMYIEVP